MAERKNHNFNSLDMTPSEYQTDKESIKLPLCGSIRLLIAFLTFWGNCMMSSMRISTSIAIVCMINHTAVHQSADAISKLNTSSNCYRTRVIQNQSETDDYSKDVQGELIWSKEIQGYIHGSIFWGYLLTQLPGALMGHKFGSRIMMGVSLFTAGVSTILCPLAARTHFMFLIGLRFVSGLAMGATLSQLYKLFSKWSPPCERSRLIGFSLSGMMFGISIALGVSAFFCQFGAWEWIFYSFGILTLVWFITWMIVVSDEPKQNRFLNSEELDYISYTVVNQKQRIDIPWLSILKSKPVWAIVAAHTTSNWIVYVFQTNLPTFLNDQLGISQFWNGVISGGIYLSHGVCIILSGIVADKMIQRKISVSTVRKIFSSIGMLGPASLSLTLAILSPTCSNTKLRVILVGCSIALNGATNAGFAVNMADLAPALSAIIFAVSNTLATVPGILSPIFIGYVTRNNYHSEWSVVFYCSTGIVTVGWIIYILWGCAEQQSWATKPSDAILSLNECEITTDT